MISVGAVDCAEKINTGLCRQYGVNSFPNFKVRVSGKGVQ